MKSLKNALVALSLTLAFCYPASAGTMMTGCFSREIPGTAELALGVVLSAVQAITAVI
jgi:hypothetical protein